MGHQFGYGLLSGIPNAAAGLADMLEKGTMQGFSNPATGENLFHQFGRDVGLIHEPAPQPAPYEPKSGAALKSGLNAVGLNPDNLPAPQSAPERIARMAGEGAVLAVTPELAAARAIDAASIPAAIGHALRSGFTGGISGAASQGAAEAVPEEYKPLASVAGGLIGGGAAELAAHGVGHVAQGVSDFAAPFTASGQEGIAGRRLAAAATDPEAAMQAIDAQPAEIVPGSQPTTFQQTGDMGLGALERSVATQNPDLFLARRADQNAARLNALSDVQAEGHPEAVADLFRRQLADIDQTTQDAYDTALQNARSQASALGGGKTPEEYGDAIQQSVNPQITAAQDSSRAALSGIGGDEGAPVIGEQVRAALQAQLDAQKAAEGQIWDTVDPDGTLNVVTAPLTRTSQTLYAGMGPEVASTLSPAEKTISGIIGDYGPTLPFRRLRGLRDAISAAMGEAKSPLQPNDVAYGRLSQLRQAVEDSISDTIQGKAAQEQSAVASGAIAPENTIGGRMLAESKDWLAGKAQATARANGTDGAPDNGTAGPIAVPGPHGTEVSGGGGPRGGSSPSGLPQDAGSGPLLDQQTADRLAAATAATKARKAAFGAKPVANILQRAGKTYPYKMPAPDVAAQLFKPGPQGATSIKAILAAAKNAPQAVEAIRNAAAASLRSKAPDGILTMPVLARWRAQHADALSALEEASPGTIARFERAAEASRALDRFKGFSGSSGALPARYFATGENGFQSVEDLRGLVGKDRADTILSDYAADSLRKAAERPDGSLDPAKLEAWRKAHSGALRAMPGLNASMSDAAAASTHLENVARVRRESLDSFQRSTAGKLMHLDDPADVTRTVGSLFGRKDAAKAMRDLVTEAAGDPDAISGLRKAVVDFMRQKLIGNTEAATSGRDLLKSDAFQSFVGKNHAALRQLFSDEELASWRAIAQDLKRANRSVSGVKLPGGSNTAQDLAGMAKHGSGPTWMHLLGRVAGVLGPGATGFLLSGAEGGWAGLASGVAASYVGNLIGAARTAGLSRVDGLITEAMLHPQVAKALLARVPKRAGTGSAGALARALRAASVLGPTANAAAQQ